MRRYLTLSEVQSALAGGKQVEQFLGNYLEDGEPAIRYLVIRREEESYVGTIYERFEPLHSDFYDVGEFRSVLPDDDAEDSYFNSVEDAISFFTYDRAASIDKFVNQGLVEEEYKDYRLAKKNQSKM